MKSDTIMTIDRRRIVRWAASNSAARSVTGACSSDGSSIRSLTIRSTCARPPEAGIVRSTWLANSTAPTRLPRRVSRRAIVAVKSTRTVRLSRPSSIVPKSTDGLRSSRNHAVTSRSSWYSRTCGIVVRAVTFQSMSRTSSPGSYSRSDARSSPEPRNRLR